MRITELLDILRDYPHDWEVELAVIAPVDDTDEDITVDRYTIEGVLPWEDDEGDEKLLWLVGGEDDNVDAFLDAQDVLRRVPTGDEAVPDPNRDLPPGLREQLDLPHAGLATFGQRPFLTEPEQLDAWQPDVAVVGAPFDVSTTNRPGARFGPRAIRALAYEPGTYHLDLGIEIFDWLEVVDYGDAHCPHGQTEVSHANIRAKVGEVASRGIVPVILGGDHSITWPAATAVADHHGFGNVGIVHFDAHADTADIIDGNLASHGTPMRRLIESGAVLGRNFVQVGLRGYWPPQDDVRVDAGAGHALAPHARGVGAGHRGRDRGRGRRGARRPRPPLRQRRHRRARPGVRTRDRHPRARRHEPGRPAPDRARAGHADEHGGARRRRGRPRPTTSATTR